jgi:hypothetical protein
MFALILKLTIGIRIGDPQAGENTGLKPFHLLGIFLFDMVEAEDVEEAVDDEMGEMLLERLAEIDRFPLQCLTGEDDIAQDADDRAERLDLRE